MSNANGHANGGLAPPAVIDAPASSAAPSKIQPNDVGWQFVPQYYNFVNKQPHRLHCFYNKRSTFVHGEEGEESSPALGQQEIHDRIKAIGYEDCKVYIHSIDSQSSAGGGIIILATGEMSNRNQRWRKFTQTFFLAEQPNGYFVLNDIFRYLKEDDEQDGEEGEAAEEIPVIPVEVHIDAPVESVEATKPTEDKSKSEPAAEPEPVSAPSAPATEEVPVEAVAAAVPDKDVSPSEPAPVEEPAAPAPSAPAVEAPKAASPAPAPKADLPNGSSTQKSSAPAASTSAPPPSAAAAPTPAPAPAAPAKPAAPRSWAAMAAGNASAAAKPAAAAAPTPAPAPAAASTSAPAQKKEEAPAASSSGRNQAHDNAMKVQTSHCFVKLPNWSLENQSGGEAVDEAAIKATASRFGDVNKVEIVKAKACAFVEFAKVESARKAIAASLPASQGGEGGIKIVGQDGKLNFETRKEKDERKKGTGQSPTQGQTSGQGQNQNQNQNQGQGGGRGGRTDQRGGPGAGAGGRGGRGRGRGGAQGGQQGQGQGQSQKA